VLERPKTWARALKRELGAVAIAMRDPRTPWGARVLGALVVAYAFSPIDLVPDFVPVLGLLDDLLLVPLGLWLVVRWIPAEVLADARTEVERREGERPTSWIGAAGVVAVWVGIGSAGWWLWASA
jgi:uncharacterized membrane protein YkvA (DUF1232 family)